MRIWIVVALLAVGCEGKKNLAGGGSGSGSQVVVAAPADAMVAPADAASADASVDAALSDPKTLDYEHILEWEKFGPLKLGLDEAVVVKLVGPPKKKPFPVEEGATGEFMSSWEWPSQGLTVGMGSDSRTGPFRVRFIQIVAPSTLATTRGAKIGTPVADLPAMYTHNVDEGRDDPNEYLVGSVYGGLMLEHKDGKVMSIFLGAMAF